MKRNSLAWFLIGSSVIALSAFELAACSSSGNGGLPTGNGGDATTSSDGGDDEDSSTGEGGTRRDGGTADAAQECGTPPQLRPRANKDAGNGADGGPFMNFFCPFSAPPGSPIKYCNSGTEHCCVPFGTGNQSTCEPGGCPNEQDGGPFDGRDIECADPIDCVGGGVCCGIGQILEDPECGNRFGKGFRGTVCKTSCDVNAGEFTLCQKQEHCSSGTCEPASAAGLQFGACL